MGTSPKCGKLLFTVLVSLLKAWVFLNVDTDALENNLPWHVEDVCT